jgi:hypothetical protein
MTLPVRGLLIPFRRDEKRDFANGTDDELQRSKARQEALTDGPSPTTQGELPWRTGFGCCAYLVRHSNRTSAPQCP